MNLQQTWMKGKYFVLLADYQGEMCMNSTVVCGTGALGA